MSADIQQLIQPGGAPAATPPAPAVVDAQALKFINSMVRKAELAEAKAAWNAVLDGPDQATSVSEVRRRMVEACFFEWVPGRVDSPRIHLGLPYLFADVVLHAAQGTKIRIRSHDVRQMVAKLTSDGILQRGPGAPAEGPVAGLGEPPTAPHHTGGQDGNA